jgi:catechol 2,3-dioxygenase-like lactoylglutathione lyase family enzyme
MAGSLGGISAITLFAEDLPRTRSFYEDVFGLSVIFEDDASAAFDFGGIVINLLQVSAAPELIAPGTVAGPDAGARLQLTVEVEDVDAVCVELDRKGVALLNGPMDRPWGVRSASFTDPAGNVWEIAQRVSRES